jgi:hypothetical protein
MTTCANTTTTETISQLPGKLNLNMVDDNDLVFSLNWGMDITDYSFEANIVSPQGEEIPMVITIINAPEGIMNVGITAASIADISPSTSRWYLDWTHDGFIRTVIAGNLVLYPR